MHKLIILISIFILSASCLGQSIENVFGEMEDSAYDENEYQTEIRPDTTLIKNSGFVSPDSILALKKKKEFSYVPLMDSLLKSQDNQGVSKVNRPLSVVERFLNSAFFRFFIWLIPIALVLIVIFNLMNSRGAFKKKKASNVHEDGEEDLQTTNQDYLRLAQDAANAGNFRPAVKYLFLRTLQQLSGAGLINYAADKTNYNYVQEINAERKKEFARLVLNYEYVWYGNVIPDKSTYSKIEDEFDIFLNNIN